MKEYLYREETFPVEDLGGCEVKVTDGKATASVTLNIGGNSVYTVTLLESNTKKLQSGSKTWMLRGVRNI